MTKLRYPNGNRPGRLRAAGPGPVPGSLDQIFADVSAECQRCCQQENWSSEKQHLGGARQGKAKGPANRHQQESRHPSVKGRIHHYECNPPGRDSCCLFCVNPLFQSGASHE